MQFLEQPQEHILKELIQLDLTSFVFIFWGEGGYPFFKQLEQIATEKMTCANDISKHSTLRAISPLFQQLPHIFLLKLVQAYQMG